MHFKTHCPLKLKQLSQQHIPNAYSLKQHITLPGKQKQCLNTVTGRALLFQTIENEIQSLESYVWLS
jgi:hypothetical protein